jgi:hypothetical protein
MKYNNIDELDKTIENRIKRTTKHYYSDWKNLDRPKYMKCKGSTNKAERRLLLIVRECGTYLFTDEDMKRETPQYIAEYFKTQERNNKFYRIDLDKLTITKA